jgi:hypothetical protein
MFPFWGCPSVVVPIVITSTCAVILQVGVVLVVTLGLRKGVRTVVGGLDLLSW